MQLREKQKVRRLYGVLERQFRNYYKSAEGQKGATGENLLMNLEGAPRQRRLPDGFWFDARGIASARHAQSDDGQRQGGQHPELSACSLKTSSPCARKSRGQLRIQAALELAVQRGSVEWVEVDATKMQGVFKRLPDRGELPKEINENLIVELYSK